MTLQDLITSAMRLLGALGSGETPSTDELADALITANGIIDGWNGEPNAQPKHTLGTFTLTGAQSYVLGVSQTWNSARPLLITGASALNAGGVQQPVKVAADAAEFGALATERTMTANWPKVIFCDYAFPHCTVHVAPLSSGTIYVSMVVPQFSEFSAVADTVTLSPGYTNMLRLELVVRLAAEYGRPVPAEVMALYQEAKASTGQRNMAGRAGAPPTAAAA